MLTSNQFKIGDDREMVRGDQRRRAAVKPSLAEPQVFVVVDVVKMNEGEDAGIGPAPSQMEPQIGALKVAGEQFGGQSACPLIEVPEQNTGPTMSAVTEDLLIEQTTRLVPPLKVGGPKVNIVEVEWKHPVEIDIDAQAPALFAASDADVVIVRKHQRVTAEHDIAIGGPVQSAILAKAEVKAQGSREEVGLIPLIFLSLVTDDLLQANQVGVDLSEDTGDPLRSNTTIEPLAFMHIVGHHPQPTNVRHGLRRPPPSLLTPELFGSPPTTSVLRGRAGSIASRV